MPNAIKPTEKRWAYPMSDLTPEDLIRVIRERWPDAITAFIADFNEHDQGEKP